jgi:nicotinate-nucleotide adenylyltransferase
LAVEGQPAFRVSDLEASLSKPSYTVNTLREVAGRLDEGCELFFLVGFDSFRSVADWRGGLELFGLASFAVFRRPGLGSELASIARIMTDLLGSAPEILAGPGVGNGRLALPGLRSVHYYAECVLEISSTDLRNRLDIGASVRYLLPDKVGEHIAKHALYHS